MSVKIKLVLVQNGVSEVCVNILKMHNIKSVRKAEVAKCDRQIRAYDAMVVRPDTYISYDILKVAKRLKLIAIAGPGFGRIDVAAASQMKISVINAPSATVITASEMICGLVLALAKSMAPARIINANGVWKYGICKGQELNGRTVVIIGCGNVGREVGIRLSAFNMRIIGFDPVLNTPTQGFDEIHSNLNDVLPRADYILLLGDYVVYSVMGFDPFASPEQCAQYYHAKMNETEQTALNRWLNLYEILLLPVCNFLDAQVFARCKRGVKIINVGRGDLINEADLLSALESGEVGGAAIDVLEGPQTDPTTLALINHPAVIATPHIATSTPDVPQYAAQEVAKQIVNLVKPGTYTDIFLCELNKVYDKTVIQ